MNNACFLSFLVGCSTSRCGRHFPDPSLLKCSINGANTRKLYDISGIEQIVELLRVRLSVTFKVSLPEFLKGIPASSIPEFHGILESWMRGFAALRT